MFVTTEQLARRAGVSREYIARLCREGGIEATKPGGRDWLIADEEAGRWLREREDRGRGIS